MNDISCLQHMLSIDQSSWKEGSQCTRMNILRLFISLESFDGVKTNFDVPKPYSGANSL